MLVIVRGDPAFTKTEVIGLDILAPRHPKLYGLIVNRLGFDVNSTTHVVSNRQGIQCHLQLLLYNLIYRSEQLTKRLLADRLSSWG